MNKQDLATKVMVAEMVANMIKGDDTGDDGFARMRYAAQDYELQDDCLPYLI